MYPELVINVIGLISGFLIIRKRPVLRDTVRSAAKKEKTDEAIPDIASDARPDLKLTVIIPVFKDDGNLPVLMKTLADQSRPADEILLVGDSTAFHISDLATVDGVRFVQTPTKDWIRTTDRTWDCMAGADKSSGDLFLFLATDVRLERDAIQLMLQAANKHQLGIQSKDMPVIAIQQYYDIKKLYENTSLFTILTGSVDNGIGTRRLNHLIDPLGPISLMSRDVYQSICDQYVTRKSDIESHAPVLESGKEIGQEGIRYLHFFGGQDVLSRLGGGRFRQMMLILIADTAPQILRIRPGLLMMITIWLAACTSIFIELVQASLQTDAWPVLIYLVLYLLTFLQLNLASRRVGHFSRSAIFFYPFWLAGFWVIFLVSLLRTFVFRKKEKSM